MKTCTKCKEEKKLTEFSSRKRKYGLLPLSQCKECVAYKMSIYQKNNFQERSDYGKMWREKNKDVLRIKKRDDRIKHPEWRKNYTMRNIEIIKLRKHKYYKENTKKIIKKGQEYKRIKRITTPLFKLRESLSSNIRMAIKRGKYKKNSSTNELLGTSYEIVKLHLEKQFKRKMSWDNYGEWHIDHKIPLASAKTEEELKLLCHYTNLQPLWAIDNIKKGAKIFPTQMILTI